MKKNPKTNKEKWTVVTSDTSDIQVSEFFNKKAALDFINGYVEYNDALEDIKAKCVLFKGEEIELNIRTTVTDIDDEDEEDE